MVDAKEKDKAPKSESSTGKDAIENDEAPSNLLNNMEEEEEDDDEDEYDEEDEEEEEEEEDGEYDEEDPEEEKVNDGENAEVVVKIEELETNKGNAVKEDGKQPEEQKSDKKLGDSIKSKETKPRSKNKNKTEQNDSGMLAANGDKPESSNRKKGSKKVETMGMVFMCSSKTKADCFRYKILGLPESKKDQVLKIYKGMRLFLFDVDLRLMYGIFKAAGPGGYNIEPNAFKAKFPSQVRFTVLDDCLPLAEENFKSVLKGSYYSRNKFDSVLKSEQVKKLCRLFLENSRGGGRSRSSMKSRSRRTRPDESHRSRLDDRLTSRAREKRKRARDEERHPRSPPPREKRRYDDERHPRSPPPRERSRYDDERHRRSPPPREKSRYDEERHPRSPPPREKRRYDDYDRPLVLYDHEPLVPGYHRPPQPTAIRSPVRLYTYERQPLDIPPYARDHLPEPSTYRVVERDRDQDPYIAYSRDPPPPLYRDPVYTVPPEYHIVSREYHHPSVVQAPEYRVSAGSRVPGYHDVEIASDYRPAAAQPEYRSRTHYRY